MVYVFSRHLKFADGRDARSTLLTDIMAVIRTGSQETLSNQVDPLDTCPNNPRSARATSLVPVCR